MSNNEPLYSHEYNGYNLNGQIISENLLKNQGLLTYSYNNKSQVTEISSPYFSQTLNYDPAGRIESISTDGSFTYNDLDQVKKESSFAYGYDSHYNRTQKNELLFRRNALDEIEDLPYDLKGTLTPSCTTMEFARVHWIKIHFTGLL